MYVLECVTNMSYNVYQCYNATVYNYPETIYLFSFGTRAKSIPAYFVYQTGKLYALVFEMHTTSNYDAGYSHNNKLL